MSKRILIIGAWSTEVCGHHVDTCPSEGTVALLDRLRVEVCGGAGCCAVALRQLGFECDVILKTGQDAFGDAMIAELRWVGAGVRGVVRSAEAPSPMTFLAGWTDGKCSRYHAMGTNATLRLADIAMSQVKAADIVVLTGAMMMPGLDGLPSAELLEAARSGGAITLMSASPFSGLPAEQWRSAIGPCLPHLDYFTATTAEASLITGAQDPQGAAAAMKRQGCGNAVVIHHDGQAYAVATDGTQRTVARLPDDAQADSVFECCARDAWNAGFAAGVTEGRDIADCILLASGTLACAIRSTGTAGVPTLEEVDAFIQRTRQIAE